MKYVSVVEEAFSLKPGHLEEKIQKGKVRILTFIMGCEPLHQIMITCMSR